MPLGCLHLQSTICSMPAAQHFSVGRGHARRGGKREGVAPRWVCRIFHFLQVAFSQLWFAFEPHHFDFSTRHSSQLTVVALQGDGAWEPRCGEKRAPAVAHGTHQNQYTKRRALLNCTSNHTSSNNDSDDMVGSEDGTHRDRQHGHCAETGFAAQTSAGSDEKGLEQVKGRNAAAPDADSGQAEATLLVGEPGLLSKQLISESSDRHKGGAHVSSDESKKSRRRKQNLRDADASSGDKIIPVKTDDIPEGSAQPHRRKDASERTNNRAGRATASTASPVAAHVVTDGLPLRKSGEAEEGLTDGAEMRASAPGAAVDQSAAATKSGEDVMQADHCSVKGLTKGTEAAGLQSDSHPTAATSSGAQFQSHGWLLLASS